METYIVKVTTENVTFEIKTEWFHEANKVFELFTKGTNIENKIIEVCITEKYIKEQNEKGE